MQRQSAQHLQDFDSKLYLFKIRNICKDFGVYAAGRFKHLFQYSTQSVSMIVNTKRKL